MISLCVVSNILALDITWWQYADFADHFPVLILKTMYVYLYLHTCIYIYIHAYTIQQTYAENKQHFFVYAEAIRPRFLLLHAGPPLLNGATKLLGWTCLKLLEA